MPKLPKHIENLFDNEFGTRPNTMDGWGADDVKSFIATILEEERESIVKTIEDEVTKYVQEAVKNPNSSNYIYAENIPLSRLDKIINLIKENEKTTKNNL